jgi:signal transduction histidine kinase
MRIHNAAALGFAVCPTHVDGTPVAAPVFSERGSQWATLRMGNELVLVRAIGSRSDGTFIGEVFGLDGEAPKLANGIQAGDQIAFRADHVFAFESSAPAALTASTDEQVVRQSDHLKEQFIATLAQDGRNPFAPLSSTIRFLQTKAPPDLRFAVDLLERQAGQMKRLLKDLLDLAKIQNSALQIKRRRVDLAWVLHSAIEEVRFRFDEKNQHFTDDYPPQRVELEADSARLTDVIANLLDNASKYTPYGGRIQLSVGRDAQNIVITVADSGIGIPDSARARIFEPFVQGTMGNEPSEGLGIGLALVRSIVELHEGTIEVRSAGPGKGSEFEVRLPSSRTE